MGPRVGAPFLRVIARAINARSARRRAMVPNIIADARTGHLWGNGGWIGRTGIRSNPRPLPRPLCISQNFRTV
jgi:hypothetical protein